MGLCRGQFSVNLIHELKPDEEINARQHQEDDKQTQSNE